jgi:Zn-dependent protease with chaperone function
MRHISIGDLPPGMPERSTEDLKAVPPTGAIIAAIVAGGLGGAALGEGLYRTSPRLAWLAWLGACLTLYAVATIAGRHGPRRSNFLVIPGLGFCVWVWTIFIWAESLPRATSGLTLARNLFLLLSILVLGAVTPVAIVLAALREHLRRHTGAMRPLRPSVAPLLISAGLATAGIAIGLAAVFGTFLVVRTGDRFLQIAALAVSGAAMPILLWPLWVTTYEWLVARWHVEPPDALRATLETLRDRVGSTFTRVVCLAPSYGRGRVCQIVHRPGRSVLIVSRSLADSLPSHQLLAVLAHEAAHVHLRHTARKVLWGTVSAAIAIGGSMAFGAALGAILPKSLAFTRLTAPLLSVTLARLFWDHGVVRRHEREADEFAVRVAGSAAMLGALQPLGGGGPPSAIVHRRWTTHGTSDERQARIRSMAGLYP